MVSETDASGVCTVDHYRAPCDGGRYGGASGIAAHFGSSMIAPQIGKFLDRYGVKKGLVLRV